MKLVRLPFVAILKGVDALLGVAQWLTERRPRTRAKDVLSDRRTRAQAPTVVLGRRRPPTNPNP